MKIPIKRPVVLAAFLIQSFATTWMLWHYDPDVRFRAASWEATSHILGAALDRCIAPRTDEAPRFHERTTSYEHRG